MIEMIDLAELQNRIYQNKINKGFNVTDINAEFLNIVKEVAEAIEAHEQSLDNFNEELADIIIYVLGIAAILKIDIEHELKQKVEIIEKRRYYQLNGRRVKE